MLKEARFKNFKLLRDVKIPLDRLSVVVGPNGVGKSSVLEGLDYLFQLTAYQIGEGHITTSRPGVLFSGQRDLKHLVSKPDASELELELIFLDETRFGVRGSFDPRDENKVETFHLWLGKEKELREIDLPREHRDDTFFLSGIAAANLGSCVRVKLDAEKLANAHYSESESPRIQYNGEGLASVLQYVHGLRDGTLEAIEQDLAGIVPGVVRIRTMPARIRRVDKQTISVGGQAQLFDQQRELMGVRFEIEWKGIGWIPADQISEGTLLALGLITLVRFQAPQLVLLDDLDKALHPVAQQKLVGHLRKILELNKNLQIVATSHSPFILDELQTNEVLVLGDGGDKGTVVRRLDEHPTAKKRAGYLRPGELWSLVGEGWVNEGSA